jgi:hypothetical protein
MGCFGSRMPTYLWDGTLGALPGLMLFFALLGHLFGHPPALRGLPHLLVKAAQVSSDVCIHNSVQPQQTGPYRQPLPVLLSSLLVCLDPLPHEPGSSCRQNECFRLAPHVPLPPPRHKGGSYHCTHGRRPAGQPRKLFFAETGLKRGQHTQKKTEGRSAPPTKQQVPEWLPSGSMRGRDARCASHVGAYQSPVYDPHGWETKPEGDSQNG